MRSRTGLAVLLALVSSSLGMAPPQELTRLPSLEADLLSRTLFDWNAAWNDLGRSGDLALVSLGPDRTEVFSKAGNTYRRSLVGGMWSEWEDLGVPHSGNYGPSPARPAAVAFGAGQMAVFVGLQDGTVSYKYWDGRGWSDWIGLGGSLSDHLLVAAVDGTSLYVFGRGYNKELMYITGTGMPGSWSGWRSLGGTLSDDHRDGIAAVSSRPGRMDVVALWSDNSAHHRATSLLVSSGGAQLGDRDPGPTGWTSWQPLGGSFTSGLTMTSWGPNRLDVFGLGPDYALYQKSWNGSSWSGGWSSLGGVGGSTPAVTALGPDRLELFVMGTDYNLHQREWNGSAWGEWRKIADCLSRPPVVVSSGSQRLDLVLLTRRAGGWHNSLGIRPSAAPGARPPACPCGDEGQQCCARYGCSEGLRCVDSECQAPPTPPPPPPPPTPGPTPIPQTAAPTISVSSEGSGVGTIFIVRGSGFEPSRQITIRFWGVTSLNTPAELYFYSTSTSGGQLEFRTSFPCLSGVELRFTAQDGRKVPYSQDLSGFLWSNTVVTSCP